MGQTLVEKIAARHADGLPPGAVVRSGDFISIRPRHVMTHDNTGAVIPKFKQIGATSIADPAQPVFAIDHDIQNVTPKNLEKYAKIEAFAREHGIDFYPAGTGISHQVMVEQGYVVPGALVVASDSHSNLYGAAAALGTPVVRTDAASIWATGVTWWQVPKVARVVLKGRLSPGVVGKDVIIALCGLFNKDEVLNHAVEFTGDGVANLPMSARMTIANMTTEWGALAGVFPFDEVTVNYLRSRVGEFTNPKRPGTRGPKSRSGYTNTDVDQWWQNRGELSARCSCRRSAKIGQREHVEAAEQEQEKRRQRRIGDPIRRRLSECPCDEVGNDGGREQDRKPAMALPDPEVPVHVISLLRPDGYGLNRRAGPNSSIQAALKTVARAVAGRRSSLMPRGTRIRSTPASTASVARASAATRIAPATSLG